MLSIDGENAGGLTHIEAQNKIRACGEHLSLGLSRYKGASLLGGWGHPEAWPTVNLFPFSRAQPAQSKLQKVGWGHLSSPFGRWEGWDWTAGLTRPPPEQGALIPLSLAGSRGWRPELGESGKLGVGLGSAARSGHHACLPVCLLPSAGLCYKPHSSCPS